MCRGGIADLKQPEAIRLIAPDGFPRSTPGRIRRHPPEERPRTASSPRPVE